jgi:acrylyl-CoA reductase (NADPH)
VQQPSDARVRAWDRLVRDLDLARLESMIEPATLDDLPRLAKEILAGRVRGRVVVDVAG